MLEHEGSPAVRLSFPEILITQQGRAAERISIEPRVPLKFVADTAGPISFNGTLVDLSSGGFACLQYAPVIRSGCRFLNANPELKALLASFFAH